MARSFGSTVPILAALLAMVCHAMAETNCDMIEIAERAIVKMYPSFDLREFKQVIYEDAKFWELTYELPITMLGGVPIVTIDKKTCKVVRIIHTQ